QGRFTQAGNVENFQFSIYNTGDLGTDTYDLTVSSAWSLALFAADGITPLTDTNADTVIDTGPIPQGSSVDIIARINVPGDAQVGSNNPATITATSSLDVTKSKTTSLSLTVPARFVNVFVDEA